MPTGGTPELVDGTQPGVSLCTHASGHGLLVNVQPSDPVLLLVEGKLPLLDPIYDMIVCGWELEQPVTAQWPRRNKKLFQSLEKISGLHLLCGRSMDY